MLATAVKTHSGKFSLPRTWRAGFARKLFDCITVRMNSRCALTLTLYITLAVFVKLPHTLIELHCVFISHYVLGFRCVNSSHVIIGSHRSGSSHSMFEFHRLSGSHYKYRFHCRCSSHISFGFHQRLCSHPVNRFHVACSSHGSTVFHISRSSHASIGFHKRFSSLSPVMLNASLGSIYLLCPPSFPSRRIHGSDTGSPSNVRHLTQTCCRKIRAVLRIARL